MGACLLCSPCKKTQEIGAIKSARSFLGNVEVLAVSLPASIVPNYWKSRKILAGGSTDIQKSLPKIRN